MTENLDDPIAEKIVEQCEKLRIAREFAGISQRQVSQKIGIVQCLVSMLENPAKNKKQIGYSYLALLAEKGVNLNLVFSPKITPKELEDLLAIDETEMLRKKVTILERMLKEAENNIKKLKETLNQKDDKQI